jgi:hypothetical protein
MRWMWLQKTDPNRPWAALSIQIPTKAKFFFSVAMQVEIGDGSSTFFGRTASYMGREKQISHQDYLQRYQKTESTSALSRKHYVPIKWVSDIRGAITVGVMVEYLQL